MDVSNPGDAVVSDAPWWLPNGGSSFGKIGGINFFFGDDIMGGENQPPCEGPGGNRCGHNVNDNYDYVRQKLNEIRCSRGEGHIGCAGPATNKPKPNKNE